MKSCDWCQGGAMDLVYNEDWSMFGEINKDTGHMFITACSKDNIITAEREINYCPMCGRPVGNNTEKDSVEWKFLMEISKILDWNRPSISRLSNLVGCLAWNLAKQRVGKWMADDDELFEAVKVKFEKRFP